MKYCNNCEKMVEPIRHMNWGAFIIGLIAFVIPGLVYLVYYMVKEGVCPMCNSRNWGIQPKKRKQDK